MSLRWQFFFELKGDMILQFSHLWYAQCGGEVQKQEDEWVWSEKVSIKKS